MSIHTRIWLFFRRTSQLGPGAARETLNELTSPIWTFFVKQSFSSSDLFRFWRLGYPEVWGSGWQGHACVMNLCGGLCKILWRLVRRFACERGTQVHRYKQSVLYRLCIHRTLIWSGLFTQLKLLLLFILLWYFDKMFSFFHIHPKFILRQAAIWPLNLAPFQRKVYTRLSNQLVSLVDPL